MKNKMKKGFTLIEIMIVVAIIAILAAVAIPNFIAYQKQSTTNSCKSTRASIKTAAESWLMQNGGTTAPSLTQLVDGGKGFLKKEPTCPKGGTFTITLDSNGAIEVNCSDADHADTAAAGTGTGS